MIAMDRTTSTVAERDELATLILGCTPRKDPNEFASAADAILAAGYHKQCASESERQLQEDSVRCQFIAGHFQAHSWVGENGDYSTWARRA